MALIALYGGDTYRSAQKLKELQERFFRRFGSSGRLRVWESETFSDKEVRTEVEGRSLFGGTKFLVIKNPFDDTAILDALWSYRDTLTRLADSVVFLLFQEGEILSKHPFWEQVVSHGTVQEFTPLKGANLLSWIAKECVRYGRTIRREAAELLSQYGGNDLWFLAHEIQKISLATTASVGGEIRREDILPFRRVCQEQNAFAMLDAASAGKKREALSLLNALFSQGEHALRICSAIGFQLRNLLMLKSMLQEGIAEGLLGKTGAIQHFIVRKLLRAQSRFSLQGLITLHERITRLDSDLKTGRDEPQGSLFMFLSRF